MKLVTDVFSDVLATFTKEEWETFVDKFGVFAYTKTPCRQCGLPFDNHRRLSCIVEKNT